jgi:hypothetical protein
MTILVGLISVAAGCSMPAERLNAPPQGITDYPTDLQDAFVFMVDNAMLEDLSMADIHFVPHQAELNGLGARRLERYAKLLAVYGGSIRYATSLTDKPMVEKRMTSVRKYLATTGISEDRIKISQDLPGGLGISAREAIAAKAVNMPAAAPQRSGGKRGKSGLMTALGGLFGGGQ